jgi:glycosyltransferase involved in cell wall biosynthesis
MNKTVIVVTDRMLVPPTSGNDRRIIDLMRTLRREGYRVVLLAPPIRGRILGRLSALHRTLQLRRSVDHLVPVEARKFSGGSPSAYDWAPFLPALTRAVERWDPVAVIAEYCWLAPVLDAVSNGALKSVDTHDLMHARQERFGPSAAWVECSLDEERALLEHADTILAIQRDEQREFRAMLPHKTVLCVPHACRVQHDGRPPRPDLPDTVAFFGSANAGNVLGLQAFIQEAWPSVRRARPAARLHVYGKVADVVSASQTDDSIEWIGYVRRLDKAYREAKVAINPVQLGTGLKIKTVEALAQGAALVTTTCGASGCEHGAGDAFVMEDDMARFADAVAGLLGDDQARLALGQRARAFATDHFSPPVAVRELVRALEAHRARQRESGPGNNDL